MSTKYSNFSRVKLKTTTVIIICILIISGLIYVLYSTYIFPIKAVEMGMAVEFNDHAAAAWIALDKGWFREESINISTLLTFKTGLELAAALARGDVNVAWVCLGPAVMAYSRGVPLVIVCMTHLHGYAIVSRPEYKDINELNNKVVVCPGPGSPCWLLLKVVMDKYNLNVQVKKMAPYIALNALISGQIDAVVLPEHYVTLAKLKGMNVLLRSQDIWPNMPGSVLVVKREYLESHPDIVYKLVKITVRALNYIENNPEDSARIVAKKLGIAYEAALESMKHLEYTYEIDEQQIQTYINLLVKYGALEKGFKASQIIYKDFLISVEEYEAFKI